MTEPGKERCWRGNPQVLATYAKGTQGVLNGQPIGSHGVLKECRTRRRPCADCRTRPCVRAWAGGADTLGLSTRRLARAFDSHLHPFPLTRVLYFRAVHSAARAGFPGPAVFAASTERVPHALVGLHGPDGATGSKREGRK